MRERLEAVESPGAYGDHCASRGHFARPRVLLDYPPVLWWIIAGRAVGCRCMMRLG